MAILIETKQYKNGDVVTAEEMSNILETSVSAHTTAQSAAVAANAAQTTAQEIQTKVANGEFNGRQVFVKFKETSDGIPSDSWNANTKYIGFAFGKLQPETEYVWFKCVWEASDLPDGDTSQKGIVKLGAAGGAATYEHTHGTLQYLSGTLSGTTLTITSNSKTI